MVDSTSSAPPGRKLIQYRTVHQEKAVMWECLKVDSTAAQARASMRTSLKVDTRVGFGQANALMKAFWRVDSGHY